MIKTFNTLEVAKLLAKKTEKLNKEITNLKGIIETNEKNIAELTTKLTETEAKAKETEAKAKETEAKAKETEAKPEKQTK